MCQILLGTAADPAKTIVVSSPHDVLGAEPFAVVETFANTTAEEVKRHVLTVLGRDYALGGVVPLKQLGLVEIPVNATHKVMKSEVQAAVASYVQRTSLKRK